MDICTRDALRARYGAPRERSVKKELPHLDLHRTRFSSIAAETPAHMLLRYEQDLQWPRRR